MVWWVLVDASAGALVSFVDLGRLASRCDFWVLSMVCGWFGLGYLLQWLLTVCVGLVCGVYFVCFCFLGTLCVCWYNIALHDWCLFTVCGYCAGMDVVWVGLGVFGVW